MVGLLSDEIIAAKTGIMLQHFVTFSRFNTLVVHKEPLKSIAAPQADVYAGYPTQNYTFTPRSGVFNVMMVNRTSEDHMPLTDAHTTSPQREVMIKVNQETRDFIKDGKNERFELNGAPFNCFGNEQTRNFLGLKFYVYNLISTE